MLLPRFLDTLNFCKIICIPTFLWRLLSKVRGLKNNTIHISRIGGGMLRNSQYLTLPIPKTGPTSSCTNKLLWLRRNQFERKRRHTFGKIRWRPIVRREPRRKSKPDLVGMVTFQKKISQCTFTFI